jgi:hypothetical protein
MTSKLPANKSELSDFYGEDVVEQLEIISQEINSIKRDAILKIAEQVHAAFELGKHSKDGLEFWVETRLRLDFGRAKRLVLIHEQQVKYPAIAEYINENEDLSEATIFAIASTQTPDKIVEQLRKELSIAEKATAKKVKAISEREKIADDLQRERDAAITEIKVKDRELEQLKQDFKRKSTEALELEAKLTARQSDIIVGDKHRKVIQKINSVLRSDDTYTLLNEIFELIPQIKLESEKLYVESITIALEELQQAINGWKKALKTALKTNYLEMKDD